MAPYIKPDPDAPEADASEPKKSPAKGYLAKRSSFINQLKQTSSSANTLNGQCFETTGHIIGVEVCVETTHTLIDTGASASFISPRAVRQAGLKTYNCEPKRFRTANGSVYHNKYTRFELYISGIGKFIKAYIDEGADGDSRNGHHVLLGVPAMKAFDMQSNHCYGRKQETRWSISHNITGMRRERYVLRADPHKGVSTLTARFYANGMPLAVRPGETAKQRHGREVVERARANLRRKRAKYGY